MFIGDQSVVMPWDFIRGVEHLDGSFDWRTRPLLKITGMRNVLSLSRLLILVSLLTFWGVKTMSLQKEQKSVGSAHVYSAKKISSWASF